MSAVDLAPNGSPETMSTGYAGQVGPADLSTPFAAAHVFTVPATQSGPLPAASLEAPFAEGLQSESGAEAGAVELLMAELEDEEFEEAVQAVVDEAAGRHLRAQGTWTMESEAPLLSTTGVADWLEALASEADRVFEALEEHFADRPVETLRDGEMEAVSGHSGWELASSAGPLDVQERFLGGLLKKAKRAIKGVARVVKKGITAVGKVLPLGQLFGVVRKLVRPLLQRVLATAISRLPRSVQPLARRVAARLGSSLKGLAREADGSDAATESLGEQFDREVAEALLVADPSAVESAVQGWLADAQAELAAGGGTEDPQYALDAARARLAAELATAEPGTSPTAQMEQFIPAVMAVLPLVRTGIRLAGRQRVVRIVAGAIAPLLRGIVGQQAAQVLSKHVADQGLRLLRLEAEHGGGVPLGMEALAAAAEDAVRDVLALPAEMLADDLLVETEAQQAFVEAAARHLPAEVLQQDVVQRQSGERHGFWLMMPRRTRPSFRYKKYSRVLPVRISRPVARAVVLSGGQTLEQRLLEEGADSWPVTGELELYELLDGSALGHLAAFEGEAEDGVAAATAEFEELTEAAAGLLAGNPALATTGRLGGVAGRPRAARRYYRLRVGGRPLRRRAALGVALDAVGDRPSVTLRLRLSERDAHLVAGHVERGQVAQVLVLARGVLGAARRPLAARLEHLLRRAGVAVQDPSGATLARVVTDSALRVMSHQLPAAAAALAQAAKDPAPGLTLAITVPFTDLGALAAGRAAGEPTLSITAGGAR